MSELEKILLKLSQYRDETLYQPDYLSPSEAKQAIKTLFLDIALEICEHQPITYEKFKAKIEKL
jgi:hypothetical protein